MGESFQDYSLIQDFNLADYKRFSDLSGEN